jgi:D-glycero-D-manno-heptose 1,7-bisphosphate phosphatase
MNRAVFLDRDGILNKLVVRNGRGVSPQRFDDFELLPGAARAIGLLKRAGFLAVVVTNQPDIARGCLDPGSLQRMHERLHEAVPIDAIYTCCHDDGDGCDCRKPKPGLILRAAKEWQIDLNDSFLAGDSWKDIEAGRAVACTTVLVKTAAQRYAGPKPDFIAHDLGQAVQIVLSRARSLRSGSKPFA